MKKPWITKGIRKSIKTKNEAYSQFCKTDNNVFYQKYVYFRDKINHLIRKRKREYHNKYFEKNKIIKSSDLSYDEDLQDELWGKSLKMINTQKNEIK